MTKKNDPPGLKEWPENYFSIFGSLDEDDLEEPVEIPLKHEGKNRLMKYAGILDDEEAESILDCIRDSRQNKERLEKTENFLLKNKLKIRTKNFKFDRDELYDRRNLH